jgi:thioesterase domain-containing protein
VEQGEIEATLFAHDAVRQVCCVPWLDHGMPSGVIAHIVPENHSAGLKDELRAYLRVRLPDYMLPSEFVLHENLPLTPQGKLDRSALSALQAAKPASPQIVTGEDGLEKALAQLWHSLLPAAGSSPNNATFASLGGDSLLAIKLMLGVEEIIDQRIEVSTFMVKPTFAGLCEAVRTRMSQSEFQPVLTLRKHGNRPPLFCLYGIDGDIMAYFDLAEVLGDDQPVFGIRSPALENLSRLPQSMEEAAAEVVRWIRKVQPQGVPSLVGYSWTGLLAFEVARQLAQQEGVSCFTAMIGSCAPGWPTSFVSRLTHIVRNFPAWLWSLIWDGENRWQRLSRCLGMARRTKQFLVETPSSMPDWVSSLFERHMIALMDKYQPLPKSNVVVDLFRERDACQPHLQHPLQVWHTSNLPDAGWNRWALNKTRIHLLEGDHMTILKPPLVSSLAQAIRSAMDQHLKRSTGTAKQ